MKKILTLLISGGIFLAVGTGIADEHEGEAEEPNIAYPMEMFSCKHREGKGPADSDAVIKKWNEWADEQGIEDYSAWTLVPYYAGAEQDFDLLWFGAADNAKALGRAQDTWLATGGKIQEMFDEVLPCDTHSAYSVLQIKAPPKRDNPSNFMVTFSDCKMSDGVTFDDLYPSLIEWGEYRGGHGSTAGMWVFFPSFGGGGEDFHFKWATAFQNLAELGADWDQFNESGWQKGNELFRGKLSCDSSRAYLATNRRMAKDDDE